MRVRSCIAVEFLILIGALVISVLSATSGRPMETHEDFVAQTSREMLESGDPIVPTFGDRQRLQKPPLMYWVVGTFSKVVGRIDVPPWCARLPSAFASVLLVGVVMGLGATVYDRKTACLAGGLTASCVGVIEHGGNARPEMLYAALSSLALLGFVRAWFVHHAATSEREMRDGPGVARWALLGWIAFAAATLAKGPHLPGLMFVGVSVYMVTVDGWRTWRRSTGVVWGLPLAIGCILPWFIAVALRSDDAWAFWANELVGARFSDTEGGGGIGHWLLEFLKPDYLLHIVAETLPWGVALPLGVFVSWTGCEPGSSRGRVLFFSAVVPLFVLSLVPHSRGYYVLPLLPSVMVLMARGVLDILDGALLRPRLRLGVVAFFWFAAAVPVLEFVVVKAISPASTVLSLKTALELGTLGLIFIIGWRITSKRGSRKPVVIAILLWAWGGAVLSNEPVLWSEHDTQFDAIAEAAAQSAADGVPIVVIDFDRDDLVYATDSPVRRVPRSASALTLLEMAPVVIVGSTTSLDRLEAEGLPIERLHAFQVDKDKRVEIVRVTPLPR